MKILITLTLCFATLFGHAQDVVTKKQITLEPYKALTNGAFYQFLCLKSKDSDAEFVSGLEFEWGYSYVLKINEIKLQSPPEDGGDTDYVLREVVSKTKAPDGYQFNLRLESELYHGGDLENEGSFKRIDDHTLRYLEEINIVYAPEFQPQFDRILKKGASLVGIFEFSEPGEIRLVGFK